jgi:type IV pilus assembly protein PilM
MQKIIGLDIGSYSIKAVEIVNTFKSYEIANFYETKIPLLDDFSPDIVIPTCLEQLFSENKIEADRIITAMPGQYISSRILNFNFSDPFKIQGAIYAEIEDVVPFTIDEMIIDHQILGQVDGQTLVLVVLTKKVFLRSFLQHLQRVGIDPKSVDVDCLSFYNLCPFLEMASGKIYGFVDMGHEKTSICLVQDGVLKMFRSINLGGRYLTDFLARDLEVSYNEAQRLKHQVSQVLLAEGDQTTLSGDHKQVAEGITGGVQAIIKELGRTLYAFKNWEKSPIERIYLSGGTSEIQNIEKHLSYNLEIDIEKSKLGKSALSMNPQLESSVPYMLQGIAIGMRSITTVRRHSQINLRKGEFAYVQDYESILKWVTLISKGIGIAMFLLCVSYLSKHYLYTTQIQKVRDLYEKEFAASFPGLKKKYIGGKQPFDKMSKDAEGLYRDQLKAKTQSIDSFLSANKDSVAMQALEKMSAGIPKELEVEVVEYKYSEVSKEEGNIKLRVEADSYEVIAKLKTALSAIQGFIQVEEKSSDTKPGTDLKIAQIEIVYKK